jgi:hypothetical protein
MHEMMQYHKYKPETISWLIMGLDMEDEELIVL